MKNEEKTNSKQLIVDEDYEPFGKDWKKHIYKNVPKKKLIEMYRDVCIKNQKIANGTDEHARDVSELKHLVSTKPAWKDVDEKLPENSPKRYLCYANGGLMAMGYYYGDQWEMAGRIESFRNLGYTITHWMELPEPPSDKT